MKRFLKALWLCPQSDEIIVSFSNAKNYSFSGGLLANVTVLLKMAKALGDRAFLVKAL
jgi:hypothetical protein